MRQRFLFPGASPIVVLAAGILAGATGSTAVAEESVSGLWKILVTQENSQRDYYLELKQEGTAVVGVFASPRSGKYPFEGGSFDGKKLRIDVNRKMGERTVVYGIEAEMAGSGKLEGKLLIGGNEAGTLVVTRQGCLVQGRWKVVTKTGDGREYESAITLIEEEGALRGKMVSRLGVIDLKSATFEGDKLKFEIVLPMQGNEVPFIVESTLKDANTLVGRWKAKDADFSGDWSGTRTVKEEGPAVEADPELAGKWYGVAKKPDGTGETFELEIVAGEKGLAAKCRVGKDDVEVKDFRAAGKKIEAVVPYREDGEEIKVKIEGQLKDGVLGGKWSVETGETGEWSARKPTSL